MTTLPVLAAPAASLRLDGLSIVLPCHDEADNVAAVVESALAVGALVAGRVEVIVVDDGSDDATGERAARLVAADERVRLVVHPRNLGYGAALRSGIGAARMPWVFLTDADGQFDLRDLVPALVERGGADVLWGYRLERSDNRLRRLNAAGWNRLVHALLGLPVRDVDCAFKLIPREALVAAAPRCDGAGISAELLAAGLAARLTVREVGVHHRPRAAGSASGARPRVVIRALGELLALRRRLGRVRTGR
jgi:glycosyltransferase involved in cell wall biosynthesis